MNRRTGKAEAAWKEAPGRYAAALDAPARKALRTSLRMRLQGELQGPALKAAVDDGMDSRLSDIAQTMGWEA